jgi:hypothetical protein
VPTWILLRDTLHRFISWCLMKQAIGFKGVYVYGICHLQNRETLSYKFCQPLKMTLVLSLTHLVSLVWPNFKNLLSTLNVESNKFYDIVSVFQLFNLTLAIEKEKKKIFGFVEHLSQTYSRTKCDSIYINNSNKFDHN